MLNRNRDASLKVGKAEANARLPLLVSLPNVSLFNFPHGRRSVDRATRVISFESMSVC
jgi:hypothetical protein